MRIADGALEYVSPDNVGVSGCDHHCGATQSLSPFISATSSSWCSSSYRSRSTDCCRGGRCARRPLSPKGMDAASSPLTPAMEGRTRGPSAVGLPGKRHYVGYCPESRASAQACRHRDGDDPDRRLRSRSGRRRTPSATGRFNPPGGAGQSQRSAVVRQLARQQLPERVWFGAQTFHLEDDEDGFRLASHVQAALVRKLREVGPNRRRAAAADLRIFRDVNVPAVVIEVGFLSHPEEESLLQQSEYQGRTAQAIANGILSFIAEQERHRGAGNERPQFEL